MTQQGLGNAGPAHTNQFWRLRSGLQEDLFLLLLANFLPLIYPLRDTHTHIRPKVLLSYPGVHGLRWLNERLHILHQNTLSQEVDLKYGSCPHDHGRGFLRIDNP